MKKALVAISLILSTQSFAKEIALTFDDAPMGSSAHFDTHNRADELIRKLKLLKVPSAMIFANPCKREDSSSVLAQLKKYKDNGHIIGSHTCTHPRLDDVGFKIYSEDAGKADKLLSDLFPQQKFFRYPFLNEGKEGSLRDQMRDWLKQNHYRNGMVSVDNDDYIFSSKINQAKKLGKKVDYAKVKSLFLKHLMGAVEFYDNLAVKTVGYSPKHVILLHEMDATVMFIEDLVSELRKNDWTIISAEEAFKDKLYSENPKNTYANNGIVSQVAFEKTGEKLGYYKFDEIEEELNKILGLDKL